MERGLVESRRSYTVPLILALLLLGSSVAPAVRAQVPAKVGAEIQVNSFVTGDQIHPAVAVGGDGSFDAVWESDGEDVNQDHGPGLYGRHFDAAGAAGNEFRVDSGNLSVGLTGRVAADPAGNFVVVWAGHGNPDGSDAVILARRYDSTGAPLGSEFAVSTSIAPVHSGFDVVFDSTGGFAVSWAASDLTFQGTILARLFDAQGQPRTGEIPVSDGIQAVGGSRIAADPRGGFLVGWDQALQFVSGRLYVRRFDAQGTPREAPIQVADSQGFRFEHVGIVTPLPAADGSFSVFWQGFGPAISANPSGLFAERFDATGAPLGGPITLHGPFVFSDPPAVAPDPAGGALVLYSDVGTGGADNELDVLAQSFDPTWQPRGDAFRVNTYIDLNQDEPALASSPAGQFFAAWTSGFVVDPFFPIKPSQDGSGSGIFGQRLAAPAPPDTTSLALFGGRFRLTVTWNDPHGPLGSGIGHPVPLTDDTGAFWFFDSANIELVIKVLDGRGVNGKFWVFYGALSDVGYDITVTDTETGEQRVYHNPPLTLASVADTSAFPLGPELAAKALAAPPTTFEPQATVTPLAGTTCGPDPTTLCLQGSRFTVAVAFTDPGTGSVKTATAVPLSSESGYFWFFAPANIELLVKVLDGRAVNGNFWVLYGALSDIDYTITVTDVLTGRQKVYHNPAHTLASVADTMAFSDVR
jgi:hypothetical protein